MARSDSDWIEPSENRSVATALLVPAVLSRIATVPSSSSPPLTLFALTSARKHAHDVMTSSMTIGVLCVFTNLNVCSTEYPVAGMVIRPRSSCVSPETQSMEPFAWAGARPRTIQPPEG